MLTLALKLALKFFLIEKSKADESPWGKKKKEKKIGPEKKERIPLCQVKKKDSFVKAAGNSGALINAGVQISNKEVAVKPKFTIRDVKSEVSFSLCKYEP